MPVSAERDSRHGAARPRSRSPQVRAPDGPRGDRGGGPGPGRAGGAADRGFPEREWDRGKPGSWAAQRGSVRAEVASYINADAVQDYPRLRARPDGSSASDDEDFREAGDRAEYRRRKRLSLAARGRRSLWRNTPTPERGTRAWEEIEEDNQRDYETLELGWVPLGDCPACEAPWRARHPCDRRPAHALARDDAEKYGGEGSDAGTEVASVCSADVEEAALLGEFLREYRDAMARDEEERRRREEEDKDVGPAPPPEGTGEDPALGAASYGGRLRPGEGEAMARFLQAGQRIPRRGEIGLTAERIARFEEAGYVMSGNRHKRMEAVRIRKENQVYTAEERAALALLNYEEKKAKEDKVMAEMKRLVEQTLAGKDGTDAAQKFNA